MNRLRLFSVTTIGILLAACSQDEGLSTISYNDIIAAQPTPVEFGTYIGEQAVTRAGTSGVMDDAALKAATGSFGVFGYYSPGLATTPYTPGAYSSSTSKPDFMYNQKVEWDASLNAGAGGWKYSPIKYWPNETGAAGVSLHTDKLTFFAYAPHVTGFVQTDATAVNGASWSTPETVGITALSGNNYSGDPVITYAVATNPSQSVDLLYGTNGGTTNFIDLTKQTTPISFTFKHALAQLGITILTSEAIDANTKITVGSVSVTLSNFYTTGAFNLRTWEWTGGTVGGALDVSTYISAALKDKGSAAANHGDNSVTGVTNVAANLLGTGNYFMLIPNTASATQITKVDITYYVDTVDEALATGYSRVENIISKTLATPLTIAKGNAYGLQLSLGMSSVTLSATVSAWGNGGEPTVVYLPANN